MLPLETMTDAGTLEVNSVEGSSAEVVSGLNSEVVVSGEGVLKDTNSEDE